MADAQKIRSILHTALEGRLLLDHPFYQRWEAGELEFEELGRYAEQYRHIEAQLVPVLSEIAAKTPDDTVRALVEQNLADELGTPSSHVELFESFADAVGARPAAAMTPATKALVALYRASSSADPIIGLGVLAAYETQAADIAHSKASGLRAHYGLNSSDTVFWDVHATLELDHGDWSVEAIAGLDPDLMVVGDAVQSSAVAWWQFLDDREREHHTADR